MSTKSKEGKSLASGPSESLPPESQSEHTVMEQPSHNGQRAVVPATGIPTVRGEQRGEMRLPSDLPITQCPTNIDLTTRQGKQLVFAAGNPADYQLNERGVARIIATHWLAYPDEAEDPETGEVRQFARVVLFTRDGTFFKTTSAWALRRLKAAIELFSEADWAAGIEFIVTARLSRNKRIYHDIRVVLDAPTATTPG